MRAFRLRQRSRETNRIVKHRDYIGLDKFKKYGIERYNSYDNNWSKTFPELCEMIGGKWVTVKLEDIIKDELD